MKTRTSRMYSLQGMTTQLTEISMQVFQYSLWKFSIVFIYCKYIYLYLSTNVFTLWSNVTPKHGRQKHVCSVTLRQLMVICTGRWFGCLATEQMMRGGGRHLCWARPSLNPYYMVSYLFNTPSYLRLYAITRLFDRFAKIRLRLSIFNVKFMHFKWWPVFFRKPVYLWRTQLRSVFVSMYSPSALNDTSWCARHINKQKCTFLYNLAFYSFFVYR